MAVGFFVLYNCFVRGFLSYPRGPLCSPLADDRIEVSPPLFGFDVSVGTAPTQFPFSLSGIDNSSGKPNRSTEIEAANVFKKLAEVDNQIVDENQDRSPSSSIDTEYYSVGTSIVPTYHRPVLHIAYKRNCHIIKCPKHPRATYGTDGTKCHKFLNQCFYAVACCQRHNDGLPRFKEVTKQQCDKYK